MNGSLHHVGEVAPPSSSGVEVIIVGCGFGGLACAIECRRKGHHVIVLERMPTFRVLGDVISFGPNAGRIFARWGLHDKLWPICRHADKLVIHNYMGEVVREQPIQFPLYGAYEYSGHRAEIHEAVYEYALSLGIDIRFGHNVESYQEDPSRGKASVTVNGKTIEADIVVAADGVKSRARQYVLGYNDQPKSSGYSVYRAWFDAKEQGVGSDPNTDFLTKDGDAYQCWIGRDVHFICSSLQGGNTVSWVITHRDDFEVTDSWSFPGNMEDVLNIVDDWDPRCAAVLSKAPSCIDWKLITHDPLPTWVSSQGRVVLLGDAAHPFLPTSRHPRRLKTVLRLL
ncbi:FAD/NAD(P)-binding domain-containing protein [Coniophora puteana RWD-64-598 SS2]|uniref:FAD/NAD(P)-binding domain-containing protein n=1 Tax=Coniophora puteana (strain RWD-64-598) TaxID=741705 RepID=A0A5M3MJR0_CONPW|nr:FAD/NAD(P)-binding domain-containing protein [Coniophora puteana RWD-64-598 SS2]EIW78875.1 FAD/NAD(P)-binding domain-containing protein [Coniophora puteana RWD-64-598 SS2]